MKPKSQGIASWPKAERPRERLLAERVEKLTEAELLAISLRVGQRNVAEMFGVAGLCSDGGCDEES